MTDPRGGSSCLIGIRPKFRRRVLNLLAAGRSVVSLSEDVEVSDKIIYNWCRQDRIDRCLEPGPTSVEKAELQAGRRRIAELEAELAVTKRAIELLKGKVVIRRKTPARRSAP